MLRWGVVMSQEMETDRKTVFECLDNSISIDEIPSTVSRSGSGWVLQDNNNGGEIPIHPDDVNELVAMLKAFHKRMDERSDVDLETDHDNAFDNPIKTE